VETVSPERGGGASEGAARKRAAMETYARSETALRRTARRYSLCADDAEDALQRALEILLRKAPSHDPRELVKWTQTVVKHEALAIRCERERLLAGPAAIRREADEEDWVALLPAGTDGPAERVERREAIARSREALQALKPQELRALTLLAEGYSYAEIGEITGFSQTKINRCLAEGRERFRKLISHGEDGSRCAEMQPLISAFCDGEAGPREVAMLREHLRACAHCRATLRTYRAAPAAAAALAPLPVLDRSLLERVQDAVGNFAGRFGGGGSGDAVSQVAVGSGAGGAGMTALAKVAAVCVATAGGAVACVATGLVPAPLPSPHDQPARLERQVAAPPREEPVAAVEYTPEPVASEPSPEPNPAPHHHEEPAEAEPAPSEPEPASSSGAVEYTPPPAPAPAASSGGDPAGEFGP
jgi:RNA polymerase sigma factor (sigma-70 family)